MKLLDEYLGLQKQLYDYFGYVEDWTVIPIEDNRIYIWQLHGEGPGVVRFADTIEDLQNEDSANYYESDIYTQRFLPKWVYRGEEYTMIATNPHVDGNTFLSIFDNSKEVKL